MRSFATGIAEVDAVDRAGDADDGERRAGRAAAANLLADRALRPRNSA